MNFGDDGQKEFTEVVAGLEFRERKIEDRVHYMDTPKQAWDAWRTKFWEYANQHIGEDWLHWRKLPEVVEADDGYYIYSRLLLSETCAR